MNESPEILVMTGRHQSCSAEPPRTMEKGVGEVQFNVLGPIEVWGGGHQLIDVGPRMVRAVLACLLVEANRPVPTDRLVDQLWGEQPPPAAETSLRGYVSALRRALEPDRDRRAPGQVIVTQAAGYVLRTPPENLDALRFEALTVEGARLLTAGRPEAAGDKARRALELWRGLPYADLAFESFIQPEIARLEQLRSTALETAMEAELALGHHGAVIAELERLVALFPLHERLRELFILALYRSGRQGEALRSYQDARRMLAEELGIEPRASLQQLEADILQHSPSLDWKPPAEKAGAQPPPEDPDAFLDVWADDDRRAIPLEADRVTIGRSSSSSIPLADATVSRLHAVVERYPGGWSIRDVGSANGTFLNGTKLDGECRLRPGDEIRVGSVRLFFRSRSAEAAGVTVRPEHQQS